LLRIRFTRTGKKQQASFRIVVAEHSRPVKGKFIEILGHYKPTTATKEISLKKDRIEHWISVGAQPSDSVASLLKRQGFKDMDKYILRPRNLQRKKKKAAPEGQAA
jgi:small subunit ribosomal protein S16